MPFTGNVLTRPAVGTIGRVDRVMSVRISDAWLA